MKILHAADLHLDSPFGGLPPERARERRRESRDILPPSSFESSCESSRQAAWHPDLPLLPDCQYHRS